MRWVLSILYFKYKWLDTQAYVLIGIDIDTMDISSVPRLESGLMDN